MNHAAKVTSNDLKRQLVEQQWLLYFNNSLYEKGIITEQERNKMVSLIHQRNTREKRD